MLSSFVIRREARGRPFLGFQLEVPPELERFDGPVVTCRELRPDGRLAGELEVSVFAAALIIDRDGILADKACEVLGRQIGESSQIDESDESGVASAPAVAVVLPGAAGFRADTVQRTALPYVHVFALAADAIVDGGVLITIRSAAPDWPAAEHVLRSLRLLTRGGQIATSAEVDAEPLLPLVVPRRP
jgi:hypothetical protein